MQNTQAINVQTRWLIRRDMADVLRIENESFEYPWSDDDFLKTLRTPNCIGMVAEHKQRIVGHFIYGLRKGWLELLNFAVDPDFRRQQVATQMINKLIGKLSQQRRRSITTLVRETNLSAQLFFRSCGFEATAVLRGEYDDTDEDAYQMKYTLEPVRKFALKNRISGIVLD